MTTRYVKPYSKFHSYIRGGNKKVVAKMLTTSEMASIINLTNCDGESALSLAVKELHLEIIQMLLDAGAYSCLRSLEHATRHAADHRNTTIIKQLIDNIPEQIRGKYCTHALRIASNKGDTATIQTLLNAGASIEDHLLCFAARDGKIDVVHLLLENGVNPDMFGSYLPPIAAAAQNDHAEIVQALLKHRANPDIGGGEALFRAMANGHAEIVKLLLVNKASPNLVYKNWNNSCSLFYAAVKTQNIEIVRLFLEHKANPNFNNGDAFYLAACNNNADIFELLIDAGAQYRWLMPQFGDWVHALIERKLLLRIGSAALPPTTTAAPRSRM